MATVSVCTVVLIDVPHALFDLKLRPPAVAAGATFSFLAAAAVVFFAAALTVALVAVAGFFAGAALPFAAGFMTIVVPALLSLTPLLRSISLFGAAAAFLAVCWRLAVLAPALPAAAGFAGLLGRTSWIDCFSGDPPSLNGERGSVRELWDFGDRTVDAVVAGAFLLLDALVLACWTTVIVVVLVVVVLARFFGFARSC